MQMNKKTYSDYLFLKAAEQKIPLSGTFELSPVCNFSCRMCYVRKTQKEVECSELPVMKYDDWIRIAEESKKLGMLYILLTGGEPLLWPYFWDLYEKLIDMGFLVSVNTNGSLIDKEAINRFLKRPPRRLNITLYGASDVTYKKLCGVDGVYDEICETIRQLKQYGICIKINCSLTPDNAEDLEKIVEFSKEINVPLQIADYMFPPIRRNSSMIGQNRRFTPKEAAYYRLKTYKLQNRREVYRERLQRIASGEELPLGLDHSCEDVLDGIIRCRAGRSTYWITWDGKLTPCGMMHLPAVNVRNETFETRWNTLVEVSKQIRLTGLCANCSKRSLCHSCAAMALAETGDFSGVPVYICEMMKEMKLLAQNYLESETD